MIKKSLANMENNITNDTSYIAIGTIISSVINCEGNIHVSGICEGDINTKQNLILNDIGKITGNIIAKSAMISGTVEGDLRVTGSLTLHAKAKVKGNIYAKHLITEEGAEINGLIKTSAEVDINSEQLVKEVPLQKKAG